MQTGNPVVVIHPYFFLARLMSGLAPPPPQNYYLVLSLSIFQHCSHKFTDKKKSYDERNEVDSRLVFYLIIEIVNISSYIEDSG